ncbi:MAG: aminotransferase class V-fold PLP-dependent enzyme [Acidimicrobiales bacterium]
MIPAQRHLFDIPDGVAYLNCAYMAPLSYAVVEAARSGAERKARPWELVPDDFFSGPEAARGLFARIIHARADDVALIPAASYGLAVAARNLPVGGGQSIVVLAEQFPSNVYVWQEVAAAAGARLVTVPRPRDGGITSAVTSAIDERTAVVAVPHCHWADGALLDLEEVTRCCRATGSSLVLDVTQSVGALPIDVEALAPDFLVAAAYKWLLGPYSAGFMYVAPHRQAGKPIEFNWISRSDSADFRRLVDYRDGYQPGARRFDVGESANFHTIPALVAALELVLEWGVDEIAATIAARNAEIARWANGFGLTCLDGDERAGHILGISLSDGIPADLVEYLATANVYVSVRGQTLRISPHVYNTGADIDQLIHTLEEALG